MLDAYQRFEELRRVSNTAFFRTAACCGRHSAGTSFYAIGCAFGNQSNSPYCSTKSSLPRFHECADEGDVGRRRKTSDLGGSLLHLRSLDICMHSLNIPMSASLFHTPSSIYQTTKYRLSTISSESWGRMITGTVAMHTNHEHINSQTSQRRIAAGDSY